GMSATGSGSLELKLDLPLADLDKSTVAGEYRFAGNAVRLSDSLPPIERANARIGFTEAGFVVHQARGRLNNGPVTITGGTKAGGATEIVARGEMTIAETRAFFDHPWRGYLSGSAPYVVTVTARGGNTRFRLESTLRGVASALPPPLNKAAADPLPLRVEL